MIVRRIADKHCVSTVIDGLSVNRPDRPGVPLVRSDCSPATARPNWPKGRSPRPALCRCQRLTGRLRTVDKMWPTAASLPCATVACRAKKLPTS